MGIKTVKLLLVEDSEAHAELMRRAFEADTDPFDITVAGSIKLAENNLEQFTPDLVIADFLLPDGKGTQLLQANEDDRKFPVVIMTSHGNEQVAVDALKTGAIDYVVKSDAAFSSMPHLAKHVLREWDHIIKRKIAETELLEQFKLNELLLDSLPHAAMLIRKDRIIMAANATARESGAVVGKKCWETFGQSEYISVEDKDYIRKHGYDPPEGIKCIHCMADASMAVGEPSNNPEIYAFGRILDTYWAPLDADVYLHWAIDITERKRAEDEKVELEKQLQQAQKMESIGTLTGGIAHDFNNMLGVILGNTELAMDDVPEWNPAIHNLEEVKIASLRARDVIRQLLSFSRKSTQDKKSIKISSIITESIKLLRSSIPTTIDIRQNIPTDLDIIIADPTQIHQVIINLCTNASHAMEEDGGTLWVNLMNIELDKEMAAIYPDLNPGKYVKLSVEDTGCGIDPEIINQVFDPYFSTKAVGKGFGMGLSVVHGIVKGHGGSITVSSEPGKGAIFDLLFPAIEADLEASAESLELIPTGNERVLLVDDDELIVRVECQILERLGYQVTARTSSIEALETFRSQPEDYDFVISDMTMPDMTGDRLAQKILEIRPGIPVILCTGFSERMDDEKAKSIGVSALVMKPVAQKELAITIRNVLDAKSADRE
jgi:signal transduction histidine kinase/DNA-binding response OmpR family regulator